MTKHAELQARLNAAVRKTWVERDGRLIGTPESCSGFSRECREVAADAITALAAAEKDAERYRFLRQFDRIEITYGEIVDISVGSETDAGPRNDAAIDAALAASKEDDR